MASLVTTQLRVSAVERIEHDPRPLPADLDFESCRLVLFGHGVSYG
jgi:hypothetical protein